MTDMFDAGTLAVWFETAGQWAHQHATNPWTWLQLVVLVVAYGVSYALSRAIRPPTERWFERGRVSPRFVRLAQTIPALRTPIVFLLIVWLLIGVMGQITLPAHSYLLGVAASLLTAWVIIRFGSAFIRNPFVARSLALAAWTIAALNITGLLGPAIQVLDSLAFSLGELRISLLTVVKGLLTLGLLLWGALALSRFLEGRISRASDLTPSVRVLLSKLVKVTMLSFAVLIAVNSVGIDLTALVVFSGAVGVGIGFGLQKLVSNLISGVILLLDKSIKPGDTIELGETFGWVSSMGARYVSVVTRDGKEYLIPNEDLITQRVVNWSFSNELVRLEVPFGVSYRSDPHEVSRIACEAAARLSRAVGDTTPVCHLVGFGDSSLDFLLRFWIRDPKNGVTNAKGEVLLAVWDALREHGIEIPYPHRQIILREPVRIETLGGAGGRVAAENV
jgi:small-conductance mechanosensitive channel